MKIDRPGPILCFGEVMLRLSTAPGVRLSNAQQLAVNAGGSEANAGALLAQLGREVEMITALPESPLGDQCEAELRRVGLGVSHIRRGDARMTASDQVLSLRTSVRGAQPRLPKIREEGDRP